MLENNSSEITKGSGIIAVCFVSISLGVGVALLVIRFMAHDFSDAQAAYLHPFRSFVGSLIGASAFWMVLLVMLRRGVTLKSSVLGFLILLGLVYRLMFLSSNPIYENDYHRYLWDGAVMAAGQNPYEYAPEDTFKVREETPESIKELRAITDANGQTVTLIGYPELTTIYPPLVISVFAVASLIDPFNLDVLRIIYLIFDAIALWFLYKCLRLYGRSPSWVVIYWLNPLLIFSTYNSAHMDVLLVAPILSAIILARKHPIKSACVMGLAASLKFWPLMLAPIVFRRLTNQPYRYIFASLVVGLICLAVVSPMALSHSENSGLLAYATSWNKNSFLFSMLETQLTSMVESPKKMSRLLVACSIIGLTVWCAFSSKMRERDIFSSILLLLVALLFLAPAGYPWYFIWILPFLCFVPLYGAALLSVFLPLYYLRYAMAELGYGIQFDEFVVPLEFGVPLLVILIEVISNRYRIEYE